MGSPDSTTCVLELGDLDALPLTVDFAPQASVLQTLLSAASPVPQGEVSLAVRRSLDPASSFAVSSFSDPRVREIPDVVMPLPPGTRASVEEQVDALRSTAGEFLVDECIRLWGEEVPQAWRAGLDHPKRWLESFAEACARTWMTLVPWWRQALPQLRHEARRIGYATVTGQTHLILDDLHPRVRVQGSDLAISGACGSTLAIGSRRLVLVPMLAPTRSVLLGLDGAESVYIGYAVAPVRPGSAGEEDSLTLLLGPLRAAIVRMARRPQTVSTLARRLNCAASTVTYHCDHLVATGLVVRERRGPATWIRSTERAAELEEIAGSTAEW